MKVKLKDIKINNREDAYGFLSKIFVGTASHKPYWKPSQQSMKVITCEVCVGIIRINSADLNEHRSVEDIDDVTYELDMDAEEDHEILFPTDMQVIVDVLKKYLTPIFQQVANNNIHQALYNCLRHVNPKVEL